MDMVFCSSGLEEQYLSFLWFPAQFCVMVLEIVRDIDLHKVCCLSAILFSKCGV